MSDLSSSIVAGARIGGMQTLTLPPRRQISPAALALAEAGARQDDLARALGCSRVYVSTVLAGQRAMPSRLPGVLEELVGRRASYAVLAAIPERDTRPYRRRT